MAVKDSIRVGVSDAKTTNKPSGMIITHSLGSCIGVCLYDTRLKVGGMLHFQLPDSKLDAAKAQARPYMFADTGLAQLLHEMGRYGCQAQGMQVKVAGGASMKNGPSNFEIGKRNGLAIRKALWKAGLMLGAADLGGEAARTLCLDIETGLVTIKSAGITKELR